jgi:hypothetical protein
MSETAQNATGHHDPTCTIDGVRRWLFNLAAAVSLLLCIAALVLGIVQSLALVSSRPRVVQNENRRRVRGLQALDRMH